MISLEKKCSIFNLRDIHAQRGWTILESQLPNFVQMVTLLELSSASIIDDNVTAYIKVNVIAITTSKLKN